MTQTIPKEAVELGIEILQKITGAGVSTYAQIDGWAGAIHARGQTVRTLGGHAQSWVRAV